MKTKNNFHAVQWVRKVRDEQAEMLADKSAQEIIAFFKQVGASGEAGATGGTGRSSATTTSRRPPRSTSTPRPKRPRR